ncbi:Protein serine/threonine kinase [Entamoeba marina]
MLLFLCFCLLLSHSYGRDWGWIERYSNDGVISFSDHYDNRKGWTNDCYDDTDYFTFNNECCNSNNMKLLIDRNDEYGKKIYFNSNSDSMTMNSLTIINTYNKMQHCLDTENMKNGLNFYFGCFESTYYSYDGTDYTCRTYLDDSKYTTVEIYSSSFTLFGDNLTITTIGASFNILNFDNIDTSNVNPINVVFTIESTDTDLTSYNLEQIGNNVYLISLCIYNEDNSFYDRSGNVYSDCSTQSQTIGNSLSVRIDTSTYTTESNEYWNYLNINGDTFTINGTAQLKATVCEFENKTITIDGDLYCTTMNINSNTKLINNGELTIDTLVITDDINDNLNENGIIESYGSISITTISITTQSNCIELISSNSTITQPSINSDYSTLLLSQNHLLRICPSSTNYEVTCTTIANTFEQQSFDLLHCPCIDSNCTINVTTTQIDTTNVEFDGTFNILTNSSIAISDQTSSFSIELKDTKVVIFGNGEIGFNQQQLNTNIKTTTTLTIESSTDNLCKALLIENEEETCIICDGNFNFDGYCTDSLEFIDNCKVQIETYGCEICYEGYESNVTNCNACPSNCLRCYNGYCINCEMNYYVTGSGGCSTINEPIISYENEKAMKCNDGYYSNGNECIQCSDSNCVSCNSSTCLTCTNSINNNDNSCQTKEDGEEIVNNNGIIECNDGYYLINNECLTCSSKYDSNCELCDSLKCYSCLNGVLINNSYCLTDTGCEIEDSKCLNCNDKGSWFNGTSCEKCDEGCVNCINTICIKCDDDYIINFENNTCSKRRVDNCNTYSNYYSDRCIECNDGYYLNNDEQECYSCPEHCTTCHNSTYCYECNDGYMLLDDVCVLVSLYLSNCKTAIPGSSGGCAICNEGYYREQTTCSKCISNCTKCNNGESCLICESNYFLLNDASECISYDELTDCETPTQSGCTKCNDGYYLNNQYCTSCDSKTENCSLCENVGGECTTCQNEYVLVDSKCINYQLIDSCTEVSNSKCISCSFWHTPNSDQTGCDTQIVWWVIVLIVLFILTVIIVIIAIIFYVTILYLNYRKIEKQRKLYTIFDMKTSNIKFVSTENEDVVINKNEILFNDECEEIGVNEETRDLICVGNSSKNTIKVQFSVKEGCDKYEIRTNPQLITIPKGKALEFEIFIKPLCTCKINDQIMLISANLSKGKTITTSITINTQTVMTSHLDYDELIEDIKLGEGSFGIVYKGTFRGNVVAIKKMKQSNNNEKAIEEFNKEVAMLDKFRSEYVIHFYGAVMIPNKICMVTELAQYGSCQDLMKKINKPSKELRRKLINDAAKGIQYLHSNVILHRDIKPDNILVISLDAKVDVIAKLTDFGSSRNVNSLMSNMTFTKGIGTPKFMAPEILAKQKYQLSSDVYSFGVTMYEIDTWKEIYPNSDTRFKFPWGVADFVTKGNRLDKPEEMEQDYYDIIDQAWKHDVNSRIDINKTIELLDSL